MRAKHHRLNWFHSHAKEGRSVDGRVRREIQKANQNLHMIYSDLGGLELRSHWALHGLSFQFRHFFWSLLRGSALDGPTTWFGSTELYYNLFLSDLVLFHFFVLRAEKLQAPHASDPEIFISPLFAFNCFNKCWIYGSVKTAKTSQACSNSNRCNRLWFFFLSQIAWAFHVCRRKNYEFTSFVACTDFSFIFFISSISRVMWTRFLFSFRTLSVVIW